MFNSLWERVWEDISKVVSGLPEAQAGGDMYPQEGENGKGDGKGSCYRN